MACARAAGSIVLVAAVMPAILGGGRAAALAAAPAFSDLQSHWARADVERLAALGVVGASGGGRFEPDRPVTRAEMAGMLVRMLARDPGLGSAPEAPSRPSFGDVAADSRDFADVEKAAGYGLVRGSAGRFRPGDAVTREEMAAMLVRALGLEEAARAAAGAVPPYADAGDVAAWARGYVTVAGRQGLLKGVGAGTFAPKARATRAQAAAAVLRAMERRGLLTEPVTVTGTVVLSEIEGRHLELEVSAGGSVTRYVLVSSGGAAARLLDANVGRRVRVTGIVDAGFNIYMRGPILRVVDVVPAE